VLVRRTTKMSVPAFLPPVAPLTQVGAVSPPAIPKTGTGHCSGDKLK
jgi:hypothetical protein